MIETVAGYAASAVGAALLYRASPRQAWGLPLRRTALVRATAAGCLLLGGVALASPYGAAGGVFAALTTAMLVAVLAPYVAAWRRGPQERTR